MFEGLLPALDYLSFANVTQHLVTLLNGLQLVPQQIAIRRDKNMKYHQKRTSLLPIKRTSTRNRKLEETEEINRTTYIISSNNFPDGDKGLTKWHLDHVVSREQRLSQMSDEPINLSHLSSTQKVATNNTVRSQFNHWRYWNWRRQMKISKWRRRRSKKALKHKKMWNFTFRHPPC